MSDTYRVTSFKTGTFKDDYGNTWCSMSLEGFGEPVTIVLKDPSTVHVGSELYGRIEQAKKKNGGEYWRFKKEQKEEAPTQATEQKGWHESPEKQESINKAVALNNAVIYAGIEKLTVADTLNVAEQFVKWLRTEKENTKHEIAEAMGEDPVSLDDIPF